MTFHILPLLLKSARLQQKIAAAHAQRNPDRLLILRLQTLRLMIQKRISTFSAALVSDGQMRPAQVSSQYAPRRSRVLN
jgi:hypothetical protein